MPGAGPRLVIVGFLQVLSSFWEGAKLSVPLFWLLSPILTSHPVGTRIRESGAPDSPAAWPGPWAKDCHSSVEVEVPVFCWQT